MGLLSRSKSKKSDAPAATVPAALPVEEPTASPVKPLDLDKAAAVIEARARGMQARAKTTGLKAPRDASGEAASGPPEWLLKCMPCIAPKA